MKTRYFKSGNVIWKFSDKGNFCRVIANPVQKEWIGAVSCIEDMEGKRFTEITAEEGEP